MISFWLAVATLLTLTTSCIFWPLIQASKSNTAPASNRGKKAKSQTDDLANIALQKQRNIEIFKERLQELETEVLQGSLEQDSFALLKVELEKNLLSDVSQHTQAKAYPKIELAMPHWLIGGLLSMGVIIASLAIYQVLGRSPDYLRMLALQEQGASKPAAPDFNKAITILTEKLKEDPTDVKKWYLLANSYAATQQYDKSAEVFQRIEQLLPKDSAEYSAVKGAYAQALYLANNEQINDQVRAAIAQALAVDPQEANALVLQGIDAFQRNAYAEAIQFWQKAKIKANTNMAENFINPSIQAAQERLGITPALEAPPMAATDKPSATGAAKLTIEVDISPEFKAKVSPEQVVFVFASPQGGKMPLAAQRLQVQALPTTITLDDSNAVMPTANLSSAETVDVTARISLSGQAKAQSGDFFARAENINPKSSHAAIKLLINEVIP